MNILKSMGETPLIRINNESKKGNVYVKLEEFNPGGSIKSRVALQMIEDAEETGKIKKGDTLIEATGGNTGIGLAIAASLKGYKLVLVIPDNFSKEKIEVLKNYGAEVILADHTLGNDSHVIVTNKLMKENPNYYNLNQFKNFSNPKAHYLGTGVEIVSQLEKKVNYFISSIGSGGTIMGIGKRLKEEIENVKIVGVQPEGCDILNNKFVPHKIQATAVGILSDFMEVDMIDYMIDITYEEAEEVRKRLAEKEGLFVGISSGANIAAALKLAEKLDKTQNIVTVAPDSGRSYLEY